MTFEFRCDDRRASRSNRNGRDQFGGILSVTKDGEGFMLSYCSKSDITREDVFEIFTVRSHEKSPTARGMYTKVCILSIDCRGIGHIHTPNTGEKNWRRIAPYKSGLVCWTSQRNVDGDFKRFAEVLSVLGGVRITLEESELVAYHINATGRVIHVLERMLLK